MDKDKNSSVSDEDIITETEVGNPEDLIKKFRERLKLCEQEKREYLNGWQRAKADLINARRQDEVEKIQFLKLAGRKLILDILPTLDGFESAFKSAGWEKAPREWRQGMENVFQQLSNALKQNGLEEIEVMAGQDFNSEFHEAVGTTAVNQAEWNDRVAEVTQKGYRLNQQLLRTAKVKLGEYRKSAETAGG